MTPLALLRRVYRWLTRCRHSAPGCPKVECLKCWEDRQW